MVGKIGKRRWPFSHGKKMGPGIVAPTVFKSASPWQQLDRAFSNRAAPEEAITRALKDKAFVEKLTKALEENPKKNSLDLFLRDFLSYCSGFLAAEGVSDDPRKVVAINQTIFHWMGICSQLMNIHRDAGGGKISADLQHNFRSLEKEVRAFLKATGDAKQDRLTRSTVSHVSRTVALWCDVGKEKMIADWRFSALLASPHWDTLIAAAHRIRQAQIPQEISAALFLEEARLFLDQRIKPLVENLSRLSVEKSQADAYGHSPDEWVQAIFELMAAYLTRFAMFLFVDPPRPELEEGQQIFLNYQPFLTSAGVMRAFPGFLRACTPTEYLCEEGFSETIYFKPNHFQVRTYAAMAEGMVENPINVQPGFMQLTVEVDAWSGLRLYCLADLLKQGWGEDARHPQMPRILEDGPLRAQVLTYFRQLPRPQKQMLASKLCTDIDGYPIDMDALAKSLRDIFADESLEFSSEHVAKYAQDSGQADMLSMGFPGEREALRAFRAKRNLYENS